MACPSAPFTCLRASPLSRSQKPAPALRICGHEKAPARCAAEASDCATLLKPVALGDGPLLLPSLPSRGLPSTWGIAASSNAPCEGQRVGTKGETSEQLRWL